jgi:hypothetical protein
MLSKDPAGRPSIQELKKIPLIQNALEELLTEFEGNIFFELRNSLT